MSRQNAIDPIGDLASLGIIVSMIHDGDAPMHPQYPPNGVDPVNVPILDRSRSPRNHETIGVDSFDMSRELSRIISEQPEINAYEEAIKNEFHMKEMAMEAHMEQLLISRTASIAASARVGCLRKSCATITSRSSHLRYRTAMCYQYRSQQESDGRSRIKFGL